MSIWKRTHFIEISLAAVLLAGGASLAHADNTLAAAPLEATAQAKELKDIGIDEHLGQSLDLSLKFKDENGQMVTLGSFYSAHHPVVISLVYFNCPGLCNFHLNGVIDTLKTMKWTAGQEYHYLAISFDAKENSPENSELAAQKKKNYMKAYNRPGSEGGWHFLTADEATLAALTSQIGFKYKWNDETKEWAHASAAVVTTSSGKISRYLHGIMFDENTFKLALNEAADGKIGTFVERMIWYCFHYDPKLSKYTLYATRVMKIGAVAIILILMGLLLPAWIRSRKGHA